MQKQGFVQKKSEKQGMGSNGPYTIYSLQIDGEWYGHGFKPPQCNEGDYVSYTVVQNGKYTNATNVAAAAAPAQAPAAVQGAATPQGSAPVNKRDISIHYQSCRKDAINIVRNLMDVESIKLPAKKGDQYDAYMALLEEVTAQLFLKLEDIIAAGGVVVDDMIPTPEGV